MKTEFKKPRPVEWIVCILVVVVLAVIFYPLNPFGHTHTHNITCMTNVKMLGTASFMYSEDYDGRLLPAATWIDATQPFTKHKNVYTCPVVKEQGKEYGYAMNRFLDGVEKKLVEEPEKAHLFYDSSPLKRNANEYVPSLPIPGRWKGTNVIAFLDGHARVVNMTSSKDD